MDRAHAYAAADADVIFVEAPTGEAEIEAIAHELPYPKLINMFDGGKTPAMELDRLCALDYRLVIVPSDLQRAAIRAMQQVLATMRERGNSATVADLMVNLAERDDLVGLTAYLDLDRRYAR